MASVRLPSGGSCTNAVAAVREAFYGQVSGICDGSLVGAKKKNRERESRHRWKGLWEALPAADRRRGQGENIHQASHVRGEGILSRAWYAAESVRSGIGGVACQHKKLEVYVAGRRVPKPKSMTSEVRVGCFMRSP